MKQRKIQLNELLDNASADHIESFIEENKGSGIPDGMLENVKSKVFERIAISSALKTGEVQAEKPKGKAKKNRRWIYAASLMLLAVTVGLVVRNINFGNPPVDISEDGEKTSFEAENSFVSENISQNISEDFSQEPSGDFEIKGITWVDEWDETSRRYLYNDLVINRFAREGSFDYAWATVELKSLEALGEYERPYVDENGNTIMFPHNYFSVAEIEIKKIYHIGDVEGKINEGEKIKIIVPWILEGDSVKLVYSNHNYEKLKATEYLPMTELGKEYVVGISELSQYNKKTLQENAPEYVDSLIIGFSYPMDVQDFSQLKGMSDIQVFTGCFQIYVAIYEQYIKGKVESDSSEALLYNALEEHIYRCFPQMKRAAWQNIMKEAYYKYHK